MMIRFKLAGFFACYVTVTLLCSLLLGSVLVKIIIGRERPTRIAHVKRAANIRDNENGTKSMPSGDTAAGSFILSVYGHIFLHNWIPMIGIPMVAMGRVYQHCHWFGDTIIGAMVGCSASYLLYVVYL